MLVTNRQRLEKLAVQSNSEGKRMTYIKARQLTFTFQFRETVWGVITGQASEATSSIVLHDVKEIETWILRLLSAPVPIPGKTKYETPFFPVIFLNYLYFRRVEVEALSPSVYQPLTFALPSHTRFSLVDFPLHLPLELLGM